VLVFVILLFGLSTRAVWMINMSNGMFSFPLSFTINRVSLLAIYFGFSLVSLEWVTLWRSLSGGNPRCIRIISIIFMIFLFILQAFFVCLCWISNSRELIWYSNTWGNNVDQIALSFYSFVVATFFLFYGRHFSRQVRSAVHYLSSKRILNTVKKVNIVSFLCAVSFAERTAFWIYGSLVFEIQVLPEGNVEDEIDWMLYPTLWYTVPDILPSLALLVVLTPKQGTEPADGGAQKTWSALDRELLPGAENSVIKDSSIPRQESEITSLTAKPIDRDIDSDNPGPYSAWHEGGEDLSTTPVHNNSYTKGSAKSYATNSSFGGSKDGHSSEQSQHEK